MFDAAARHLNFRLASEELHVTQGAVAQQVRGLEADLGCKLFHRKARGLELTEIGRSYHAPVRRALAIIEEATLKLQPQSMSIILSVTPSFAAKWLVPHLDSLERAHPEIELQTLASEKLADFETDGVDLAIRQGQPPFGKGLQAKLLALLDLRAVCAPAYARDVGQIEQVADFAAYRLIQDSHTQWDKLFDSAGLPASDRKLQFNQTALAMDAAMNGQGIALVPRLLAEADIAQGRLIELWRSTTPDNHGFYVVCPNTPPPGPAKQAMINWLIGAVG